MITTITLDKLVDEKLFMELEKAGMKWTKRDRFLDVDHEDYDLLISICKPYMPVKPEPVDSVSVRLERLEKKLDAIEKKQNIL